MRRREFLIGLGGLSLASTIARLSSDRGARAAQTSTPSPTGIADSLGNMAALAPDVTSGPNPPEVQVAVYANPALQLATMGEPPGGRDFAAWANAAYWIAFPAGIAEYSREPRWRQTFGFEARQVDQALEIGEPPHRVKHLRGRFDLEELRTAWTASGYAPVDIQGVEAFSWAAEPELEFDSDVSRFGVGNYNNAAILPDGSVHFAGWLTDLRYSVAAASGEAPVLGAAPEIADLVATLDPDLATAYILTADAVRAPSIGDDSDSISDEQAAAIDAEINGIAGALPKPELIAVGVTAGGPWPNPFGDDATPRSMPPDAPFSENEVAILFADRGDAEAAIPIIDARLTEAQSVVARIPYREFFPTWEIRLDSSSPVVDIRLSNTADDRPGRILAMLNQHDLAFISWSE